MEEQVAAAALSAGGEGATEGGGAAVGDGAKGAEVAGQERVVLALQVGGGVPPDDVGEGEHGRG
jgi:hypothetical protein